MSMVGVLFLIGSALLYLAPLLAVPADASPTISGTPTSQPPKQSTRTTRRVITPIPADPDPGVDEPELAQTASLDREAVLQSQVEESIDIWSSMNLAIPAFLKCQFVADGPLGLGMATIESKQLFDDRSSGKGSAQLDPIDGWTIIGVHGASGTMEIRFAGYLPAELSYSGAEQGEVGACGPVVLEPGGSTHAVHGTVRDPDGSPLAYAGVEGCGNVTSSDLDGSFYMDALSDGPCKVRASWMPGLDEDSKWTGELIGVPVEVDFENGDAIVDLDMIGWPPATIRELEGMVELMGW